MKKYIITIMDMLESKKMADRCIKSGANCDVHGIEVWPAITPKDDPVLIMNKEDLPLEKFVQPYSKFDNVVSCFLSHYMLWKECVDINEPIMILEHDAEFIDSVNVKNHEFKGCISIGAPSYGRFVTPNSFGVNKLVSKQYFPGAHAYIIKPEAAKVMIERAKKDAAPTDVFLNNARFDFLEEYYPWPVRANDEFTTIQESKGIAAKHNYLKDKQNYKVMHAK